MSELEGKEREMPAAIEAKGLRKQFRHVVAVDGIDLEVRRGEIFGLIGPDGAGKTTTLRLLAAVMRPTSGFARVLGYDVVKESGRLRHLIGYMPQRFSLYGDLTVMENLLFFADIFGVKGEERSRRIEQLLAFSRLAEFRGRRAARLSGGMQKKLALACTLIHKPQVLFLDEPTTGVDPVSRREFWDILSDLHVEGVTLFVSTPYMDEAERCNRVGLMFRGQIIQEGTPEQIKGLVPGEVLSVWTRSSKQARSAVENLEFVAEVQTYGDAIHLFVDDAERRMPEVQRALEVAGVPVEAIRKTPPRIEEAFISIIRRRRSEGRLQ